MKPKKPNCEEDQGELFRVELEAIVDARQPLVKLGRSIRWEEFDEKFEVFYDPKTGRPGNPTRLMVGLHYLKYTYDLSDEEVVERWSENPYWQHFCGEKYFEYKAPIDPSSMTRWRKKVGVEGAEEMLKVTIQAALELRYVRSRDFQKINVDTTVQEKAITFPTDSKLYHKMRQKLVKLAREHGVSLRQSYVRKSKESLVKANRYFHARQAKRGRREVRRLKTYLGRVTRDIRRKIEADPILETKFATWLSRADRILEQKKSDKNKLYSIHAPEVECIAKGKAHKKYEFGNKVSVVSLSKRGLVLGMKAFHGNPFDGHTLQASLDQAEELSGQFLNGDVFTDRGYRGHDYSGPATIHIAGKRKLSRRLRRWMRRRSAVEAKIGHMKSSSRLDRNYLLGTVGDEVNALLCGCGANLKLLIAQIQQVISICLLLGFGGQQRGRGTQPAIAA